MKNIFTLLMLAIVVYCSSCGNGGNDSPKITPIEDSISKGSYMSLTYADDSAIERSYFIRDYKKGSVTIYTLFASVLYNHTDSLYHLEMQLIDQKKTQISVIFNGTGPTATGDFYNHDNSCAFIDYLYNENNTYAVGIGSRVTITSATYPIMGDFDLILNKNHYTTHATGNFSIFF